MAGYYHPVTVDIQGLIERLPSLREDNLPEGTIVTPWHLVDKGKERFVFRHGAEYRDKECLFASSYELYIDAEYSKFGYFVGVSIYSTGCPVCVDDIAPEVQEQFRLFCFPWTD